MAKFQLLNPVLRVVGQKYDEKGIPVGEINRIVSGNFQQTTTMWLQRWQVVMQLFITRQ